MIISIHFICQWCKVVADLCKWGDQICGSLDEIQMNYIWMKSFYYMCKHLHFVWGGVKADLFLEDNVEKWNSLFSSNIIRVYPSQHRHTKSITLTIWRQWTKHNSEMWGHFTSVPRLRASHRCPLVLFQSITPRVVWVTCVVMGDSWSGICGVFAPKSCRAV